jgi:hypothetical protein
MNIERELLERILNHMSGKDRPYFIATCKEIKELLAQPETEQEPVRYEYQDEDGKWQPFEDKRHYINNQKWGRTTRALYTSPQKQLAQPETNQEPVGIVRTIGGYPDTSEHTVELTCRHGDLRDGDLLYKAPLKREPLSKERLTQLYGVNLVNDVFIFARQVEMAHGITGVDDE